MLAVLAPRRCGSYPRRRTYSTPRSVFGVVLEAVAEPLALGAQVGRVVLVLVGDEGHPAGDVDPEGVEARRLGRVVRQQPDVPDAEVAQDRRADAVLRGRRRAGRARGWRRRCRSPGPAARRPAACGRCRCRGPRGRTGRRRRRGPRRRSSPSPRASCGPQSQRREPKTSPVRHSLCTRTRTSSAAVDVAADEGQVRLVVARPPGRRGSGTRRARSAAGVAARRGAPRAGRQPRRDAP